jgi:type I restriction enzyme, S subunit
MSEKINTRPFYNSTIPTDWDVKELGKIFAFKNGINAGRESYGKGVKFINVMEVIYNDYVTSEMIPGSVQISDEQKELYQVKHGDVLFNRTSETTDEIGLTAVYYGNDNVVFGGFVIRGRPIDSSIDDKFKRYCFRSKMVRDQIIKSGQGAVRTNIGQGDLEKVEVALPKLPEQKAIAHILSLMDTAINKNNLLVAKKELEKKWLMQNLLTGKKRLKGFHEDWKEYSYEKLLKVVKRPFDWNENELYKLISVRRRSGGIFFRDALYGHQILVKNLRTSNEGDFLFSKMQILHGASALVTKEFAGAKISGSYIAVVANDKKQLNMEFFNWYSQMKYFYHQTYISSYGVHIEKMTFDFDIFLQLEMKLPSFEEQVAITKVLNAADKEIQLLKAKTEKLRLQKKGMMQVLLTGKKRVRI